MKVFVLFSISCMAYSHYLRITDPHVSVDSGIYHRKMCLLSADPFCAAKKVNKRYEKVYIHGPVDLVSQ